MKKEYIFFSPSAVVGWAQVRRARKSAYHFCFPWFQQLHLALFPHKLLFFSSCKNSLVTTSFLFLSFSRARGKGKKRKLQEKKKVRQLSTSFLDSFPTGVASFFSTLFGTFTTFVTKSAWRWDCNLGQSHRIDNSSKITSNLHVKMNKLSEK